MGWDERHAAAAPPVVALPEAFRPFESLLPTSGHALELACGTGGAAVWLARRGLEVVAVDSSPVALARAASLDPPPSCRFVLHDLEHGLPPGPPVDVLLCHRFRDVRLYPAMADRLAPGGLLLLAVLTSGTFGAAPGELDAAFASLQRVAAGDGWLVARRA